MLKTASDHGSNKYRTCLVASLLMILMYAGIVHIFPENELFHLLQKDYVAKEKYTQEIFRPLTINGVFTFFNVCLEPLSTPASVNIHGIWFTVTQRIVIYDRKQSRLGKHRLSIAGPSRHPWNYYDVYFTNESLPLSDRTPSDSVAYFVSPRCPGNLHHFFHEEYFPLYSVISLTNRLNTGAGNLVIYNTPKTDHNPFCRNFSKYNEIVRTLFTNGFHDVYYNIPKNTCFKNAVFGSRIMLNNSRDVVNHIIKQYNLSDICVKKAEYITLIYRKHRRIVNMEDLHRWVMDAGFKKEFVRVIDFDNLPIRKQIELACTSEVMIGVDGAALQWSMFMPEKSHMVEMSWPSRSWGFFYPSHAPRYGILYHAVELKDVRVNWTSYEFRIRNGGKVADVKRQQMLKSPPQDLWKWSDGFIHEEEVNETLLVVCNSVLKGSAAT